MSQVFESIFTQGSIDRTPLQFIICLCFSLVLGLILTFAYSIKTDRTPGFAVTLALLPAAVAAVIIAVNGNIGVGVAVAGAFGLVRFRSTPGGAREICAVFISMGAGLICGIGYLAYAAVFTVLMSIFFVLYNTVGAAMETRSASRILNITIPEDINYTEVFDDVFEKYTKSCRLISVKTAAMGSMYRLKYELQLRESGSEKDFIDELRCRNGNLEISLILPNTNYSEL